VKRGHALQVIDANLNRLREGLRVAEDFVRYLPGVEAAFGELKDVRLAAGRLERELRDRLGEELARARRLERDSGKSRTPPAEADRRPEDIAPANLKRAQEAARSIEECLKVIGERKTSTEWKKLRFQLYAVETNVLLQTVQPARAKLFADKLQDFPLYLVVDELNTQKQSPQELMARYYRAGGRVAQLRMKNWEARDLYRLARNLMNTHSDLLLIVNDRLDVALAAGAHGVHLGTSDLSLGAIGRIRGELIVGISARTETAVRHAAKAGADYIGVSAIFPTSSKKRQPVVGLQELQRVATVSPVPVVAIGGINADNIAHVLRHGALAAAVISAVADKDDAARLYRTVRSLGRKSKR